MNRVRLDSPDLDSRQWQGEDLTAAKARAQVLYVEARPFLHPPIRELLDEADLRCWSAFGGQVRLSVRWRGVKVTQRLSRHESAGGCFLACIFDDLATQLRGARLEG